MSEAKGTPPREYNAGTLDIVPGSADLPADGEKTTMTVESPSSDRRRRWIVLAIVLFILVLIATVIGLAVGLSQSKTKGSNDTNSQLENATPEAAPAASPAPTESPAVFADRLVKVKNWITAQQYSSAEALNDPNSPQTMAMEFMASDSLTIPTGDSVDDMVKWLERYVLSLFYYSTNGPNWIFQFNFLSHNLDTCGWYLPSPNGVPIGASCIGGANFVNTLLFNFDNNLVGQLPSELGLLTSIQNIILIRSNIQGTLPDSFANLSQMQWFDCTGCALDGSIPDWIGQWTSLAILGLTGNALTGSLPSTMRSLTALQEVIMEDNLLTGALTPVEGMDALEMLIVGKNGFVDTFGSNNAAALQNLTVFDISDNKLVGSVPVHLFGYPSLQIVDLHGNLYSSFPDTIPTSDAMEFLALYGNPFEGSFPIETILNLSKLTHLDVSITGFTGSMPVVLGNLTMLEYLFLADTNFTAGPIPDEYQQLRFLKDFSLKHSGRTGVIPSWMGNLDRVVLLDLDDNALTGTIPSLIGDMISLEFLLLNRNQLNGIIPTELAMIQNLQVLFVDENAVTGDLTNVCDVGAQTRFTFFVAADCNGTSPLVTCPCCARCCDPNNSIQCNSNDFFLQQDPTLSSGYSRNGLYDIVDLNITGKNT